MGWNKFWHACQAEIVAGICLLALLLIWRIEVLPILKKPLPLKIAAPVSEEDRDYLRMMYEEHAEHARLHEELRGSATSLFIALVAGLLAFAVGSEQDPSRREIVAGVIICVTSVFGALVSFKHYERYNLHLERVKAYRSALENGLKTTELAKINKATRKLHESNYPLTHKIHLNELWLAVYLLTGVTGLVLAGLGLGWFNK